MKRVSIMITMLLIMTTVVTAQTKEEKHKQDFDNIKSIIESNSYEFKADKVLPQGMGQIDLTTVSNHLKIYDNTAEADLPFFGEAYHIGYGGQDGGIDFVGEMKDKEVKINEKKQKIDVSFKVDQTGDYFNCHLTITRSGSATLTISSYNRSTISYTGHVSDLKVEV